MKNISITCIISYFRSNMTPPSRRASIPVPPPTHPSPSLSTKSAAHSRPDAATTAPVCNGFRVLPELITTSQPSNTVLGQQHMSTNAASDYEPLNFSNSHYDDHMKKGVQQPLLSSFR